MAEKNVVLWITLVLATLVGVISFMVADVEKKPQSPQALVAAAFKSQASAPAWRPLPGQSGLLVAAAARVYYEPTIRDIVMNDCSRCHSGALRNLMDYDSLVAYADSGLLAAMVQGPMAQFAGQDAQAILDWIDAGVPEDPRKSASPTTAATISPLLGPTKRQRVWSALPRAANMGVGAQQPQAAYPGASP